MQFLIILAAIIDNSDKFQKIINILKSRDCKVSKRFKRCFEDTTNL